MATIETWCIHSLSSPCLLNLCDMTLSVRCPMTPWHVSHTHHSVMATKNTIRLISVCNCMCSCIRTWLIHMCDMIQCVTCCIYLCDTNSSACRAPSSRNAASCCNMLQHTATHCNTLHVDGHRRHVAFMSRALCSKSSPWLIHMCRAQLIQAH